MQARNISLFTAVLININVIIGAGLFINPKPLTQLAGEWGFLTYLLCFLIIAPIFLCISELAARKPTAGGLYVYSHSYLSPLAGFVSGWAYFLGKATSAVLLTFTFCTFFQKVFPVLQEIPTKALSISVLFLLVTLNILGVRIGGKVQWLFTFFKAVPIGFVILSGLAYFFLPLPTEVNDRGVSEFLSSIPMAIFALCGFEAMCSIAHLVENPERNLRRAIIISMCLVAVCAMLFQMSMFKVLGFSLTEVKEVPVLAYVMHFLGDYPWLANLLNLSVYASITGAAFGMLTANCWNLHKIAEHNHVPFSGVLTSLTKGHVPWASLLVEACFASMILLISDEQIPLQNMAVFGMTCAYLLSTCAALKASFASELKIKLWIPLSSLMSCSYILFLCMKRIITSGLSYTFLLIFAAGIVVAVTRVKTSVLFRKLRGQV